MHWSIYIVLLELEECLYSLCYGRQNYVQQCQEATNIRRLMGAQLTKTFQEIAT